MTMKPLPWILGGLAALLLAALQVAATPQSLLVQGSCGGTPGPAAVETLWADSGTVYVGRADGYVQAINRTYGTTLWTWPSSFAPNAGVRSITGDATRLYVAVSEVTNNADDPVLALDRASGQELWRRPSLRTDPLRSADPFRVALDGTDATDPYLYVGMNGGVIVKLRRSDGAPLTLADGSLAHYTPPGHADSFQPNGIYALVVGNGKVIAARDWGNSSAGRPVDLYNSNNTLLNLNKDLTPASGTGEFHLLGTGGTTPRTDAIFALWRDGSGDLYLGGAGAKANGKSFLGEAQLHRATVGAGDYQGTASKNATQLGLFLQSPAPGGGFITSYVGAVVTLSGDATSVYAGTQGAGSDPRGYFPRLNKADLTPFSGWPAKTSFSAGVVRAIDASGPNLLVGHTCSIDPVREQGAMVYDMPKSLGPRVVVDKPTASSLSNGRIDVATTAIPFGASSYTASFSLGRDGGACACYTPFEQLGIHLLGLTYATSDQAIASWDGVLLPVDTVPDGPGYRLRAEVTSGGSTALDYMEGTFTLDRRAPDIEEILPAPGSTVTDPEPTVALAIRDLDLRGLPGTLVDVQRSSLTLNGFPVTGLVYETNGFHVTLGSGSNLPLRQGLNDLVATVYDRAGNVATRSWQVKLDSEVDAPVFDPPSGGFVSDTRPFLSARVPEAVSVVEAVFNGTDVTSQVSTVQSPDGSTTLLLRPAAPLSTAFTYEWRLTLRDAIGNTNDAPFRTTFRVDNNLPEVRPIEPLPNALLIDDRPAIVFTAGDAGSGLVSRSVTLYLDGVDRTRDLKQDHDRDVFSLPLIAPLKGGPHLLSVTALDVAGNLRTFDWPFRIDLASPRVQVDLLLPNGQDAVKKGDHVVVRVTSTDDSDLRGVFLDARDLDAARRSREPVLPVPGRPGLYETNLTVADARTRAARVLVTAEDAAGHVGQGHADVQLDNAPPVTVLDELPAFVGSSFELSWRNEPRDEQVGGSGVAYYRVEQQVASGEWSVLRARVETPTLVVDVPEGAFRALHYRVTAVDRAGNVQVVPSNVADTESRGDPFPGAKLPHRLVIGDAVTLAATASPALNLNNGLATLQLQSGDGRNVTRPLDAFGRLYSTTWNLTEVPAGDYVARFHFRDADGFELVGSGTTLQVLPLGTSAAAETAAKASPAPLLAPLAGLAVALALRRRPA